MLPKNVDDAYPLSPMQRLMLLHAISAAGNGVLVNQVCYDVRGRLDAAAFRRAWDALVARHAALRSAFLWEGLPQPLQVVRSVVTLPFSDVDLSEKPPDARVRALDALRRENATAPMPLGKAPLMRCTLARLGAEHHYFMWAVHHLIVDRWSHAVLFADLCTLYAAERRGERLILDPPARFRDYIEWTTRQDRASADRFWRDELAGFHEPTLLREADAPDAPGAPGVRGRRTTRHLVSERVTAAVLERATEWRTTPAALMLAAVGLLIAVRTGRDDVVCGITVSGRPPDLRDAETMVGSFVNNLPARLTLQRDRSMADWVHEVQRVQVRRQAYAHVALTDVHAVSDVPPARPLFDTLVLLNLTDDSAMPWPGIELIPDVATLDAAYPLLLSVTMERHRLALTLVHDATLAQPDLLLADLDAMLSRLAAADVSTRVAELLPPSRGPVVSSHATATVGARANGAAKPKVEPATADLLLGAWRDVLGVEHVGFDDDFFALGGTSLTAAQLFTRVERITGKTLPLSTLFAAGSVRALLAAIDRPLPRTGTIVGMRTSGTRPPLYAIPGIGGNVVGLAGLARALGSDQPFFAFESPGLDGREPPLTSIDEIAERYATDVAREEPRPFHLLGLCWGAAVVAEVTRRLTSRGRAPISITLIDPTSILRASRSRIDATGFLRARLELYWDEFREGDWSDRTRLLANKARRAARVIAGGEERRQSQSEINQFKVIEANKDAVVRYVPSPLQARARIFITRYRGEGDDPRLEWLTIIEPRPDVVPVGGVNAGDTIAPANVGAFAETLRAWLCTASGGSDEPARSSAGNLVADAG